MYNNNIFGKRLKFLRGENEMTGEELGKIFNVTKVAVSNWESGRRSPDQVILSEMASYFEVTLDYLFGRTNVKNNELVNKNLQLNFYPLNDEMIDFIDLFYKVDNETKKCIYALMKKILKNN